MSLTFGQIATLLGVPSIISGIFMLFILKAIDKKDKRRNVLEQTKLRMQILTIDGLIASISLGECTVRAVKKIDPKINGKLDEDFEKASNAKKELREFLQLEAIRKITKE